MEINHDKCWIYSECFLCVDYDVIINSIILITDIIIAVIMKHWKSLAVAMHYNAVINYWRFQYYT